MTGNNLRRIRLDISDIKPEKPLVWFLINPKPHHLDSVRNFKVHMAQRFNFQESLDFSLYLNEFEIPEDESINLLRDDDLLVAKRLPNTLSLQLDAEDVAEAETRKKCKKKKKMKRKCQEDDEMESKKVKRNRIDKKQVGRGQSYVPAHETPCDVGPSTEPELTSSPNKDHSNKKKKKVKTKKKKKKETREDEEDQTNEDRTDQCSSDEVPNAVLEDTKAPEDPNTLLPKRKRKRKNNKNKGNPSTPEKIIEEPATTAESVIAPLNFHNARWQPAGSHLHFNDEVQDTAEVEDTPVEADKEEVISEKRHEGPIVVVRRQKNSVALDDVVPQDINVPEEGPREREKPRTDYAQFQALEGPPRLGDVIAYKELEMSADYCPLVSDYKEGVVSGYDAASKTVRVEYTKPIVRQARRGRFELTAAEDEDREDHGDNLPPEIAETEGSISLDCMIEPRLLSLPCSQRSPVF